METGAPVESVRCIAGPSPPRPRTRGGRDELAPHQPPVAQLPVAHGRRAGRGRCGAARAPVALRRSGRCGQPAPDLPAFARRRRARSCASCRSTGPPSFARGVEVTLDCDESTFEGTSVSSSGWCSTASWRTTSRSTRSSRPSLRTQQRGEVARWPLTDRPPAQRSELAPEARGADPGASTSTSRCGASTRPCRTGRVSGRRCALPTSALRIGQTPVRRASGADG